VRPPALDRSISVVSKRAFVFDLRAWMIVQSSSQFWNRSEDHLWCEFVFGTTPKSGQAKLSVGVHGWLLQNSFPRVAKMAHERVVEPRLPLLDVQGSDIQLDVQKEGRGPNIEVLMFVPKSECQFSMNQLVVAELKEFSGTGCTLDPGRGAWHTHYITWVACS